MYRISKRLAALLPALRLGSTKTDFFTNLWNKPQTRDERVKEYVPEVLEESLAEQRAVLEESTSRDVIVELGNKIVKEIDSKSPTPSIAPHLNQLLLQYGVKDIIALRPLSYLLYPNSSALSGNDPAHELVAGFPDNFRAMVEEVERNGCSASTVAGASPGAGSAVRTPASAPTESVVRGDVIMTSKEAHEPMDITLFVKVVAGMAMANLHCGDLRSAVRCVDVGIAHVKEASRLGGLLALKAGLLVRQKKWEEAANSATLAVEASGNMQGYLHGSYALRRLNRVDEALALLQRGREEHPMCTEFEAQIEAIRMDHKLALTSSSSGAAKEHEILPTPSPSSEVQP